MILDDGGDATLLVHNGRRVRGRRRGARSRRPPRPRSTGHPRAADALAGRGPAALHADRRGDPGRDRGDDHRRASALPVRRGRAGCCSRRSTSTTRSPSRKFDNKYGCRHSLIDGINRATDVLIGGKVARRLRLRRRRQGLRRVAARPGRARDRHRDRPDLRAAGGDGRLPGRDARGRARRRPTSSSPRPATRTSSPPSTWRQMKHQAIVGNIGHFDNEIDMAGLAADRRDRADQHQAAGRRVGVPRRPRDHRAVRGPAAEPRQRDRAPELRDVQLVHQPGDRPDRAVRQHRRVRDARSTRCPSTSTRRSRGCTSTRSGVKLTELTADQAAYLGVPVEGPYKPDHYRY